MKRIARIILLLVTLVVIQIPLVTSVLAQASGGNPAGGAASGGNPATPDIGLTNPLNKIESLPDFLNAILDAVITLGTILLTLAIIYVGFLFVVAQGNEEKIKAARGALMWTVIGGLILLGAKTIGLVIASTVGTL